MAECSDGHILRNCLGREWFFHFLKGRMPVGERESHLHADKAVETSVLETSLRNMHSEKGSNKMVTSEMID
jgi:hypothetical protein